MTSTAAVLLFHSSSFSLFLLPYFHFLSFPPFFPALRGRATLSSCLRPNNNNAGVVMRPPLKRPCEQSLVILFATQWGGHTTVDPPGISAFSPSHSSQLSRRSGGLGSSTRGEHGRKGGLALGGGGLLILRLRCGDPPSEIQMGQSEGKRGGRGSGGDGFRMPHRRATHRAGRVIDRRRLKRRAGGTFQPREPPPRYSN